jgi:hypothetical protein
MTPGTAFHDTASTTSPAYDFIARPKTATSSGNPTFGGVPMSAQPASVLASVYVPEKPPGFSRPQKIVVGVLLAAVLGLLASFGWSAGWRAYQEHRRAGQVAATHVVLPDSIVGMSKKGGALQVQVDRLVHQINTPTPAQGAAYAATKSRTALVLAGTYAMSDKDQQDYLAGVAESVRVMGITLSPVDAGHLGGQMTCGSAAKANQTLCAFTDVAAYGVLVVPGKGTDAVQTAGAFRTAVERRS